MVNAPIFTITGSDPIGGSGIQADLKIISALGGYAVSAVTSVTVQNTLGIQDFYDLPASVVEGQIEAIVNDVEPQTVKIGLIRTKETLEVVVRLLERYKPRHVVYMPVTYSVQGDRLMPEGLEEAIREHLVPLCSVVIPNEGFSTHGDANAFASVVAYYLNEGLTAEEAMVHAREVTCKKNDNRMGLRSRGMELYELFAEEVERSFHTNSDVRFYADRLNVASGYLAQVTKRIKGSSPKAIIDERIYEEAKRLLLQSACTIQEAAYALGFTNQAHFAKFFKKQAGISPTQFRKQKI